MFKISINDMQLYHQEIEEQIIKHRQIIVEVENIRRNMREIQELSELKERLRYKIKDLEKQQDRYSKILKTLEAVIVYYNECEKRNIDRIELGKRWELNIDFKQNDFTSIVKELGEIKLGGL